MILYIDTSSAYCRTAIVNKTTIIAEKKGDEQLNHSRILHTQINELLEESNQSFDTLKAICVMNGPGSYTGLRVGLSAAKSFCYAKSIPMILLNKLACLNNLTSKEQNVLSLLPARQDEFFTALSIKNEKAIKNAAMKSDEIITLSKSMPVEIRTLTNVNVELDIDVKKFLLDLNSILFQIHQMYENQEFSDIFRSEPFYIKGVHANKAKPKF